MLWDGIYQESVGGLGMMLVSLGAYSFFAASIPNSWVLYSPDWSNEQLRKHKDELQSLLGNFYLRLLSKKIISRLPQSHQHVPLDRSILLKHELHQHADSPRESEIANASGVCRELRASLSELSQVVDTRLRKFEVAEALEAIIACLNDVCFSLSLSLF